jgi:serine/threonine protein kinase
LVSSAPPPQLNVEPGTKLDRYELLCVLAHGGMANVWLARLQGKMGFQKLFAIKTILPNVADDPSFKAMFLDEAQIASRIEHPNVVHMVDVGECAGIPYLVMDLVEGEPLQRLPRACEKLGERLPLGVVLRVLADACHGLHAAHELRDEHGAPLHVVHRDMSPQNILISSAGVSKVIDFGVAKARDRTGQTTIGTLKGKINYMPREQACGQPVDRRTDTWALGAVLYYLLAGRPPYKEEQQLATLQLAMNAAPIPPLAPTVPLSLRTVVSRALADEPAQRFQTAAEMGEALEGLMRKLGVVTTHAEVGAFVQKALGDRLDARRQLIATALAAAGTRERAKSTLTVPDDLDSSDNWGSHDHALVAVPTDIISAPNLAQQAASDEDTAKRAGEGLTDPSTRAAFVTGVQGRGHRRIWPFAAGALGLALVGLVLIALSLRAGAKHREAPLAAAAAATAPEPSDTGVNVNVNAAPPTTSMPDPPTAASAEPSSSAEPSGRPVAATTFGRFAPRPPVGAIAPAVTPAKATSAAAPAASGKPPKRKEDYGF